jgi:hypothetical protein
MPSCALRYFSDEYARGHGSAFTVCELPALLTNTELPSMGDEVSRERRWPCGSFGAGLKACRQGERLQVVGPVLNKLTALTQRTPLRLMLGQSSGLDLGAAIREHKILLMPLSRG